MGGVAVRSAPSAGSVQGDMGRHHFARLAVGPSLAATLVVTGVLVLGGCGSATPLTPGDSGPSSTAAGPSPTQPKLTPSPSPPATTNPATGQVELVGRLEEGVERCVVLRTDSGKTYEMLDADPSRLVVGARVRVRGVIRTDVMSYCMQGPIVQVSDVEPA
jgi:Protein of unknown function (DUF5818)